MRLSNFLQYYSKFKHIQGGKNIFEYHISVYNTSLHDN